MTPIKLNRAPLTKRISALALTATAALTLSLFSPSAEAAPARPTKEYLALQTALKTVTNNPNATIEAASAQQLADALIAAVADAANVRLKPGNLAGEALKYGSNVGTEGKKIGDALVLANTTDDTLAAADAVKRAGTGKDPNVSSVSDFSTAFFNSDAGAFTLAGKTLATKPGTGAVIGGRASQLTTMAAQETLVNQALAPKSTGGGNLKAAVQDIVKYVAIEVDVTPGGNTATFTVDIAKANVASAAKVGTGGVAGDPTNGGNIVDALLKEAALPKLKSGIIGFVKTVGAVADIEEISKIALAVGTQISTAATKTTAIKFSSANGVVGALAKAIVAKATTNASPTNPNSFKNKQDEIAEVAAYMVAKVLNPLVVNGTPDGGKPQLTIKNAGAKILSLITSAVNATKGSKIAAVAPTLYNETAEDVAGSVAETLASLRDLQGQTILPEFFDAIKAYLISKAKSIGGTANIGAVTAAINAAYEAGAGTSAPDLSYEDGSKAIGANLDPAYLASDYPETDFRPN